MNLTAPLHDRPHTGPCLSPPGVENVDANYVQWHMREVWKPLLFTDEASRVDKSRRDPVAPARRSKAALDTVHSRQLADATAPVSFTRLLAHMATIVRNTMRPKQARPGEANFTLTTRPNAKQQQALDPRHHRRVASAAHATSISTA